MNHAEATAQLKDIADDVKVVKEILTGNGNPAKGLVIRFDRIEQSWLGHQKFAASMWIAGGVSVLSFAGSLVLLVVRLKWGV